MSSDEHKHHCLHIWSRNHGSIAEGNVELNLMNELTFPHGPLNSSDPSLSSLHLSKSCQWKCCQPFISSVWFASSVRSASDLKKDRRFFDSLLWEVVKTQHEPGKLLCNSCCVTYGKWSNSVTVLFQARSVEPRPFWVFVPNFRFWLGRGCHVFNG